MKILLASDAYIYQTNGVANVVIGLAKGLSDRGHDVKVLATSDSAVSRKEGCGYLIRSRPAKFYPDVRITFARRDPLLDELAAWKPDLIHLHTEASIARLAYHLADETHAPLVMTAHTDYAHYVFGRHRSARPVRALLSAWGSLVYRKAAAVIAPSEKARHFAQMRSAEDRVVVIPNGIPLSHYRIKPSGEERAALYAQYGLKDNGCTIVMVTRVSKEKNIGEVLRYLPSLVREVPETQLIIAGDGPERHELEAETARLGLGDRVRFTGRIPPEEVYRIYAMGDVFVSASTFEVHSLTNLEAMANGLPLVCREDASLLGVLDSGENGFIYRTEAEFVEDVSRVFRDRELRERLSRNAARKAEEFSEERFVDRTIALYESLVKRG